MADERMRVALIIEVLGRPPEYLKETLEGIIQKIGEEKGTQIISKNIRDAKKIEKIDTELYSSFAEIEIETELLPLLKIVFTYMPSHVEIINPDEIRLKNYDLSRILTEIMARLHQCDEIVKKLAIDKSMLEQQLKMSGLTPVVEGLAGKLQGKPVKVVLKKKSKAKKVKKKK